MEEILKSIPGIGEKTYKKYLPLISHLAPVGLTPKKVRKELRKHLDKLPEIARADLIYNPMRKVPREVLDLVSAELGRFPGLFIGGSYVRGKPTSGDMDIVIRHNSWNELRSTKFNGILIREPFAFGEHKIGTMITLDVPDPLHAKVQEFLEPYNYFRDGKINIKVDFFLAKPEEYLTTKLFAIGSGNFNIIMRTQAKKRGYLLNNEGLFKNGKRVSVKNEKEIFELIGVSYREPSQRL